MQHSSEVYLTMDMLSNEIKYYLYECDRKDAFTLNKSYPDS